MPQLYPTFTTPTLASSRTRARGEFGVSASFDYQTGDIALDGAGRVNIASGRDTYLQWCLKLLHTERGELYAYPGGYGLRLADALNQGGRDVVEAAISSTITDALLADPAHRTLSAGSFAYDWSDDSVHISFELVTADGYSQPIEAELSTSAG